MSRMSRFVQLSAIGTVVIALMLALSSGAAVAGPSQQATETAQATDAGGNQGGAQATPDAAGGQATAQATDAGAGGNQGGTGGNTGGTGTNQGGTGGQLGQLTPCVVGGAAADATVIAATADANQGGAGGQATDAAGGQATAQATDAGAGGNQGGTGTQTGQLAYVGIRVGAVPECGLVIVEIFPNSPAAQSGLQLGDVIVAVDGQSLADLSTGAVGTGANQGGAQATPDAAGGQATAQATDAAGGTGGTGEATAQATQDLGNLTDIDGPGGYNTALATVFFGYVQSRQPGDAVVLTVHRTGTTGAAGGNAGGAQATPDAAGGQATAQATDAGTGGTGATGQAGQQIQQIDITLTLGALNTGDGTNQGGNTGGAGGNQGGAQATTDAGAGGTGGDQGATATATTAP
jgi:hypothetical protein